MRKLEKPNGFRGKVVAEIDDRSPNVIVIRFTDDTALTIERGNIGFDYFYGDCFAESDAVLKQE